MDVKLRDDAVLVADGDAGAEFVALQPVAIVDHVVSMSDEQALRSIIQGDDIGGSFRVDVQEVQRILGDCLLVNATCAFAVSAYKGSGLKFSCFFAADVEEYTTKAGGSAANTTKGTGSSDGARSQHTCMAIAVTTELAM